MAYLTLFCGKFPTNSRKKSQRSGRGGVGIKPVGPNSQLLPKICFASFPKEIAQITIYNPEGGKLNNLHTVPDIVAMQPIGCHSQYQD